MKRTLISNLLKSLAAATVLALGATTGAYAAGPMSCAELFKQLDADGNGVVSKEESAAHESLTMGDKFAQADKDSDGSLSKAEFSAFEAEEACVNP